jgi:hypothetical protein
MSYHRLHRSLVVEDDYSHQSTKLPHLAVVTSQTAYEVRLSLYIGQEVVVARQQC